MEVATRDVTASCPGPVYEVDRSFATPPPKCVFDREDFLFREGTWADLGIEAAKEIGTQNTCLDQVREWLAVEIESRGLNEGATHEPD